MVRHAATVINTGRRDDEGLAAHRRWKGREFTRTVAKFGGCVMYLPAASVRETSSTSDGWMVRGWELNWRVESQS